MFCPRLHFDSGERVIFPSGMRFMNGDQIPWILYFAFLESCRKPYCIRVCFERKIVGVYEPNAWRVYCAYMHALANWSFLCFIRGCELGREIHSTEKAIMQSGLWCGLYNRISLRSFFCILPKKLSASLAFEICFILTNINDQVESNTLLWYSISNGYFSSQPRSRGS